MGAQMLGDDYRKLLVEPIERAASFDQDVHSYRVGTGTQAVTRLRQRPETHCSLLLGKALLRAVSRRSF
jgi:hypothetical protein